MPKFYNAKVLDKIEVSFADCRGFICAGLPIEEIDRDLKKKKLNFE